MEFRRILPIIGIIIFIYIFIKLDISTIISVILSIPLFYSILSFSSILPIILITNYEWQILLKKQKILVDFSSSLKNILLGYFYGFITPGGIGAYTRVFYLHKTSRVSIHKCLSNIILFNTLDYITLLLIAFIGGVLVVMSFPNLYYFLFIIITILCVVILLTYLFIIRRDLLHYLVERWFHSYVDSIKTFYEDIPSIKDMILPFVISMFGWIIRFYIFYLIAQLFSIHIDLSSFIAIVSLANIIASVPITIYGLGTREATLITLFSLFDIPAENTMSLSIFWFVVIWLFPSFLGGVIAFLEGRETISFGDNRIPIQEDDKREKDDE